MAKFKTGAGQAISWMLFHNLRHIYKASIEELKTPQMFRRVKLNGYCPFGLSVFPLAVASWEAFLNEKCMSSGTALDYPNSILWEIREQADRWDAKQKAYLVPKLLLGRTFSKDSQPYQDFLLLAEVRNHIVHYKLEEIPEKPLRDLAQRKITLIPPKDVDYSWPLYLQSTEATRWAINTISKMVQTLDSYFPAGSQHGASVIFEGISDTQAKAMFAEQGIDPEEVEVDISQRSGQ